MNNKLRGQRAAQSGLYGEATVQALLEAAGFDVVAFSQYDGSTPTAIKQYPVPHPFRPETTRTGRNDLMLETGVQRIYCQVKNQNGSGTCDEKLAFTFDIARYALSDLPFDVFALFLMGTWWLEQPGIIEWARRKCTEFQMLAAGTRRSVTAELIIGPQEAVQWIRSLPIKTKQTGLF